VEIRGCTIDDFDAIVPLLQQLWPGKPLHRESLRRVVERALGSESQCYLCAVEDGRVVGFGSMTFMNSLWVEGPLAYVDELVVEERSRGRGIGGRLTNAMTELARKRGAKRIELDSAFHRKEAHRFYEESGFERRAYVFTKPLEERGPRATRRRRRAPSRRSRWAGPRRGESARRAPSASGRRSGPSSRGSPSSPRGGRPRRRNR